MPRLCVDDLTRRSTPAGDQWVGSVLLPPFACFRDGWARDGTELSDTRSEQARCGVFPLLILGFTSCGAPAPSILSQPTEEQLSAFEHLIDEVTSVRDAVCTAVSDYVRMLYDAEQLAGVSPALFERLSGPESVAAVLQVAFVHILLEHASGVALVGLELRSTFIDEEEHGLAALLHRSKALRVGPVDDVLQLPPYWKERHGLQ